MTGLQMPLQSIADFQQELRDRRYTKAVVALAALTDLKGRTEAGEAVSASAWNHAWALAFNAVPPPAVATPATAPTT
jgi:hypothetical protein